ncbi:hypothetical protein ABT093_20030 [Kitasatospora sp. NPDC002551]|uniref:hypothetical protein n=1 Tax=Kitasatospora sp. NPDC002551 TaxID=3154539 RepID=UPI003316B9BC
MGDGVRVAAVQGGGPDKTRAEVDLGALVRDGGLVGAVRPTAGADAAGGALVVKVLAAGVGARGYDRVWL